MPYPPADYKVRNEKSHPGVNTLRDGFFCRPMLFFMDGFHVEDKSPQQAFRVRGEILETAAITIFPITQRFCPQDPCLGGDGQDIMLKMGIENLDGKLLRCDNIYASGGNIGGHAAYTAASSRFGVNV